MNDTDTAIIEQWLSTLRLPGRPDEYESKQLLKAFGIPVPGAVRFNFGESPDSLGFEPPYAVKVCSPDIGHKTDANGVALNVSESGLHNVIQDMGCRFPGAALLIEEMVFFQGPEFIVGTIVDPDYGTAVMAGAGGILTELYKDAGFRLAPCSEPEAMAMLDELAIAPVLNGFRGMTLDRLLLARIVCTAGRIALALGDCFSQLDINPVVFSQNRWIALDAQLILSSTATGTLKQTG
ncbi:MAG: acetate--CoA ligase family protein [Pseudomonadota bacterium]